MSLDKIALNLQGLVDALSATVISAPEDILHELLMNAQDACVMRKAQEPRFESPHVAVEAAPAVLTVSDNGVGMTEKDLLQYFSTIGPSLKRLDKVALDTGSSPGGRMIGGLDLGVLAYFMVADRIEATTRSWKPGSPAFRWRFDGGDSYRIEQLPDGPVGTRVTLHLNPKYAVLASEPFLLETVQRLWRRPDVAISVNGRPCQSMATANPRRVEPQVFLSYAREDRAVADKIAARLKGVGARVFTDRYEMNVGDSLISKMEAVLAASDYVVVLLSPHSVRSQWVTRELAAAYSRYINDRAVTLLPVLIQDCEIPFPLSHLQYLDLRTDVENGIGQLVRTLGAAPGIDFSRLSAHQFEQLVADLLSELGFRVEAVPSGKDEGIDIVAMSPAAEPFGPEQPRRWLVQVKHYPHGRADLKSVRGLVDRLDVADHPTAGVVVTTGQFTSAVHEWASSQTERGIRLDLLDGTALKRLLLKHPDVARKHFGDAR